MGHQKAYPTAYGSSVVAGAKPPGAAPGDIETSDRFRADGVIDFADIEYPPRPPVLSGLVSSPSDAIRAASIRQLPELDEAITERWPITLASTAKCCARTEAQPVYLAYMIADSLIHISIEPSTVEDRPFIVDVHNLVGGASPTGGVSLGPRIAMTLTEVLRYIGGYLAGFDAGRAAREI